MAKFRPLRRDGDPEVQRAELVRHAEQIDRVDIMHGQLVEATMLSGEDTAVVRHSLGRAYRGAFIAGLTGATPSTYATFNVSSPAQAVVDGVDITRDVQVTALVALGRDETFLLWVF